MSNIDYNELSKYVIMNMTQETTKTPTGTWSPIMAHGNGGLFSPAGLSRGIANAMLLPSTGLMSMLPSRLNNDMNPLRAILTGVTADTGSEGTDRCDDPPTAGTAKLCTVSHTFGWVGRKSRELRLDKFGRRTNRGEFMDHILVGNPFDGPDVQGVPVPGGITPQMVTNEIGKVMFELSVSLNRTIAPDIYTGNPANNSGAVGDSGREYYNGLDILLNTGYNDAITNQACPAADSIVEDFNNVNINDNPDLVVRTFASIMRRLNWIADGANLSPVEICMVMHPNLFYELTELWPCAFLTNRCNDALVGTQSRVVVDAERQNALRTEMRGNMSNRTGQFLWIDGQKVKVILDNSIAETSPTTPGEFCSDVYFVPLTVKGGGRFAPLSDGGNTVTYMEYFNFNAPNGTMAAARMFSARDMFKTGGGGRWLFKASDPANLCVDFTGWVSPRLIVETPHLGARFTNLCYTPIAQIRSPFTDSAYFADGGRTDFLGYGASFYAP